MARSTVCIFYIPSEFRHSSSRFFTGEVSIAVVLSLGGVYNVYNFVYAHHKTREVSPVVVCYFRFKTFLRVVHGLDLFVDLIGLDRIWSDNRCLFF